MNPEPNFDLQEAHRYFSAECFNQAWDMIDLPARTPAQGQTMLQLGLASMWHWQQRQDHTPINLSVGHWQLARIYNLLGKAAEAKQHAVESLALSQQAGDFPFYIAYAYEALARAESIGGDKGRMDEYLQEARRLCARVPDPDDIQQLSKDLDSIEWGPFPNQ